MSAPKLVVGRDVLIFFEDRDQDTFIPGDRRLRRRLRKAVAALRPNKQRVTGFEVWFILLCRALKLANQRTYVNDFALARRNPHFPVTICGYPHILDDWNLPNPAVLGPGLFDDPKQRPTLMQDTRFCVYLMLCGWMRDMFASVYDRDALHMWFGGIDLEEWPDTKGHPKDLDVLVYDKIRWNREHYEPALLEPILAELSRRNLSYAVLRYGRYTHGEYRKLLGRSRSMLFLCEHETQGMAYQEAMACNVPILAWDQGYWLDPNRERWADEPVPATSVPYFSERCGERFIGTADFAPALERFIERLEAYAPRAYVEERLSLRESAELFMEAYRAAAAKRPRISSGPVPNAVSKLAV